METKMFIAVVIALIAITATFIYLNSQQKKEITLTTEEVCKIIEYNGEDRLDLLFISNEADARRFSEVLLDAEPYKSHRDYFNIYQIEEESPSCQYYKGIAILCDTKETRLLAKNCPHDYIFVVKAEQQNIRSSSFNNILSLNSNAED